MALDRQLNVKGQMRLDVPHIRSIESGVAHDFDVLAGSYLAGRSPIIAKGFTVVLPTGAMPASSLQVNVAGSVIIHYGASENGSLFSVPDDRAAEMLSATNPRVVGGFAPGQTNYIGIDLVRSEDVTTSDLVEFLDPTTLAETPKTIPLGRTIDYKIVISSSPFSTTSNIAPILIVNTNGLNQIVAGDIQDARQLMWRLGTGGDYPNSLYTFPWAAGRVEGAAYETGKADKAIASEKDWKNAIMTRLWELGGGEHWFSPASDRGVHVTRDPTQTFVSSADNFEISGSDLHWKGLKVVFDNSTGWYNNITDNASGSFPLVAGECAYVDINRASNATVTMQKGTLATLGAPAIPGSRYIVAWCSANGVVWTKDYPVAVGTPLVGAAGVNGVGAAGAVKLNAASYQPTGPVVPAIDSSGVVVGIGISRANAGGTSLGAGTLYFGTNVANDTTINLGNASAILNIASSKFNVTGSSGNTSIGGTLVVTEATTLGTLSAGATTLSGALGGTSASFSSTLNVTGNTTLSNLAVTTVTSAVTFNAAGTALTVTNNASVGGQIAAGSANITGNASVGGTFGATGAASFAGSLSMNGGGSLGAGRTFTVQGATIDFGSGGTLSGTINGNVNAMGAWTFGGSVNVTGSGSFTGNISGAAGTVSSLNCTGNGSIGGTLTAGASTLASLGVTGNGSVGGTFSVAGNTTLAGTLSAGASTVNGALTVTGAASLQDNATVYKNLYLRNAADGATVPLNYANVATLVGSGNADSLHRHDRYLLPADRAGLATIASYNTEANGASWVAGGSWSGSLCTATITTYAAGQTVNLVGMVMWFLSGNGNFGASHTYLGLSIDNAAASNQLDIYNTIGVAMASWVIAIPVPGTHTISMLIKNDSGNCNPNIRSAALMVS